MIKITEHGAQVLSWQPPQCSEDVLWVSKKAIIGDGLSARGGIPICWPWFGKKDGQAQHGFVRKMQWQHIKNEMLCDETEVNVYRITDNDASFAIWPHHFELTLELISGNGLEMTLTTKNTGNASFEITQALHTYFLVGNINNVWIEGLESIAYYDKTDNFKLKIQEGSVRIVEETDRIYITQNACKIIDPILKRTIHIQNFNSKTTVVWNPWEQASKLIEDMDQDEFKHMLCVETANAKDDIVVIQPQSSFKLACSIKVTQL